MMAAEFRVLGDVQMSVDGHSVDVGPAKQRCVLALLVVNANLVTPTEQLIERVWDEQPPHRARNTLAGYVSRLRAMLTGTGGSSIVRRSPGYVLYCDTGRVDLYEFRRLTMQPADAVVDNLANRRRLESALRLWRGEPFADVESAWLNKLREALHREYLAADLDLVDIRMRAGEHSALLPALMTRVAEHPWDERAIGQLMLALYRSGRQADALRLYQDTRTAFVSELGLEPGIDLCRLHQSILLANPALSTPDR
jgi:DNA-binding SARP family transcriptional activator